MAFRLQSPEVRKGTEKGWNEAEEPQTIFQNSCQEEAVGKNTAFESQVLEFKLLSPS